MRSWAISDLYVSNTKILTGMKMQDLYHQKKNNKFGGQLFKKKLKKKMSS
jgi:hypothetical protein